MQHREERVDLAQQEQNKNFHKQIEHQKQKLGIYIHIPFCVHKCNYCDFLSLAASGEKIDCYVNALTKEIEQVSVFYQDYMVDTIFLGGGTPSILPMTQFGKLIKAIQGNFAISQGAEITIECNPGTLDMEKLHGYKEYGINRISIGLQSTEDKELRLLGRIHRMNDFLNNFHAARQVGFDNINIDIMSALPDQSVSSYKKTLHQVGDLQPEHISAYSLMIEENTPLELMAAEWRNNGLHSFPEEEQERQMYYDTKEILSSYGYERYEISNYAKPGCHCRHNVKYWRRENYLGLGLGASSMVENVRWKNIDKIEEYTTYWLSKDSLANQPTSANQSKLCRLPRLHIDVFYKGIRELQELSLQEQMEEFMFLGLRCKKGIAQKAFENCFQRDIKEVYGNVLDKWISMGLLCSQEGTIFLSEKGLDVSNYILADFILD